MPDHIPRNFSRLPHLRAHGIYRHGRDAYLCTLCLTLLELCSCSLALRVSILQLCLQPFTASQQLRLLSRCLLEALR